MNILLTEIPVTAPQQASRPPGEYAPDSGVGADRHADFAMLLHREIALDHDVAAQGFDLTHISVTILDGESLESALLDGNAAAAPPLAEVSVAIDRNLVGAMRADIGGAVLPPAGNGLPPAGNGLPPAVSGLPPAGNGLPPAVSGLPPAGNGPPSAVIGLPPAVNGLPPGGNGPTPAGVVAAEPDVKADGLRAPLAQGLAVTTVASPAAAQDSVAQAAVAMTAGIPDPVKMPLDAMPPDAWRVALSGNGRGAPADAMAPAGLAGEAAPLARPEPVLPEIAANRPLEFGQQPNAPLIETRLTAAVSPAATLTLPPGAAAREWGDAVGERINWMISREQSAATLRLDPPTLGKLDVQLKISDEVTTITIQTQHAQARELLDAAAPRLRELLLDNGFQNVNVDVSQRQERQQADGQARGEALDTADSDAHGEAADAGDTDGPATHGNRLLDTFA